MSEAQASLLQGEAVTRMRGRLAKSSGMLFDFVDHQRAVRLLERELDKRGLITAANEALAAGPQRLVTLPGFNVFSRGERLHPYLWCVPKPRVDAGEVVSVWEEYVDCDLGRVRNPARIAKRAVAAHNAKPYFGPSRPADAWRMPLVKMIALTQHAGVQPQVRGQRVEAEVEGAVLMVDHRGAWSNFHGRRVNAHQDASDLFYTEAEMVPLRTRHALANFLSGNVHDELLWLANVAIRAEGAGLVPRMRFARRPPTVRPQRRTYLPPASDILGAAAACEEILSGPPQGMLPELFRAAVPTLMTSRAFTRQFGDPYGSQNLRTPSEAVRQSWREKINNIVETLEQEAIHA